MILQDVAILKGLHNCTHYIFNAMNTIFDSPIFLDFQAKMLIHLEMCDINDLNTACIDSVLPGVVS